MPIKFKHDSLASFININIMSMEQKHLLLFQWRMVKKS